jgi:copper chaperone CopZ
MWKILLIPGMIFAMSPLAKGADKTSAKTAAKSASVVTAPSAAPGTAVAPTAIVGVNGMVCSFCAQGIEKKFKAKTEVESINVDLDHKKVTIHFKPGQQLDDKTIKEIIIQEAGYEVVSISRE